MPSASGIEARPQPMKMSGQGGWIGSEAMESACRAAGTKPGGSHDQGDRNWTRLVVSRIGARRAIASARPMAWFSMPARPSLTAQMLIASAGWEPTLRIRPAPGPASEVLHLEDLVRLDAARAPSTSTTSPFSLPISARATGEVIGDLAGAHVGFVFADDLVFDLFAGILVLQVARWRRT